MLRVWTVLGSQIETRSDARTQQHRELIHDVAASVHLESQVESPLLDASQKFGYLLDLKLLFGNAWKAGEFY
jgi:hypothetical protein